jgi:MoxR-like ATPase
MSEWYIFQGRNQQREVQLPEPPPWRIFARDLDDTLTYKIPGSMDERQERRGKTYQASDEEKAVVNAAIALRRPILITGQPGVGKSSLAYAIAYELGLGNVLIWSITTRTTLDTGLYQYDAIGRLREANRRTPAPDGSTTNTTAGDETDIGRYIRLGPLGTALLPRPLNSPRVLLVDEIDKSDVDLPNDLLHVFEEGAFTIPELARLPDEKRYHDIPVMTDDQNSWATIRRGVVQCTSFPIVIFTSNGEREFPPAFKRRCIQLQMLAPNEERLNDIVKAQFQDYLAQQPDLLERAQPIIEEFWQRREGEKDGRKQELATDQLLNALHLLFALNINPMDKGQQDQAYLDNAVLKPLSD